MSHRLAWYANQTMFCSLLALLVRQPPPHPSQVAALASAQLAVPPATGTTQLQEYNALAAVRISF